MQVHIQQPSDDGAEQNSHDHKGEQHCRSYQQVPVLRYALVHGYIFR